MTKKILILTMLLCMIGFTVACNNSNEPTPTPNYSLVGEWVQVDWDWFSNPDLVGVTEMDTDYFRVVITNDSFFCYFPDVITNIDNLKGRTGSDSVEAGKIWMSGEYSVGKDTVFLYSTLVDFDMLHVRWKPTYSTSLHRDEYPWYFLPDGSYHRIKFWNNDILELGAFFVGDNHGPFPINMGPIKLKRKGGLNND